MRWRGAACLAGLALLLAAGAAVAHPLAPALLELREAGAGRVEVTWKTSVLRAPGIEVEPVLPAECRPLSTPRAEVQGEAVVTTWAIDCGAAGLVGRRVGTMKKFGARQIWPTGMKSRTGSQRSLASRAGLAVKNVVTSSHV